MTRYILANNAKEVSPDSNCPYDMVSGRCGASLSLMVISSGSRGRFCATEDYDNCPVFLAKMLRKPDLYCR